METELLFEKIAPLLKKNILPIVLGIGGTVLLLYGLIQLISSSTNTKDNQLTLQKASLNRPQSHEPASKIEVDIEGAVIKPGVYRLEKDSRMHDVLVLSGGLSSEADRGWFEKNINLASRLSDGQKVYIPRQGEDILTGASTTNLPGSTTSGASLININSASIKDLDSLPGVGPVTAQKIVDGRPYQKAEDLFSRKVVTSKVYSQIKDKVTAN